MRVFAVLLILAKLYQESYSQNSSKGLCHYCQCPSPVVSSMSKAMISLTVNCKGVELTNMPNWDLGAGDEVYLIMQFGYNKLESITREMIPARPDIYQMFLNNNNISYIGPQSFCNIPEMKYLTLSSNKLEKIRADAFESCEEAGHGPKTGLQLLTLDLSDNLLHSLDDDLFDDLTELRELILSENYFTAIDTSTSTALNKLHKLRTLNLARNKLMDINPGISTPVKFLNNLNLAGNELSRVPADVLKYSENLVELNLNENPIVVIHSEDFGGLGNLRILNMSVMPRLELISERSFEPLVSLEHWQCRNNYELKYLHPNMFGSNKPQHLEHVDLSANHLTIVDKNILGWWQGEDLNMQRNPFFCDCEIGWLRYRKIDPELLQDVRCESGPPSLQDKLLIEVPDDLILCDQPPVPFEHENYAVVAALIGIASLAIIVIAVAIVAIMRQRSEAKEWTSVRYKRASNNEYF